MKILIDGEWYSEPVEPHDYMLVIYHNQYHYMLMVGRRYDLVINVDKDLTCDNPAIHSYLRFWRHKFTDANIDFYHQLGLALKKYVEGEAALGDELMFSIGSA